MHTLDTDDPLLASLLVLDGAALPDGTLRVVARLRDGRSFSLTLLTLEGLQHRLRDALSYVAPRVLVVREPSEAAILEAARTAVAMGIERFGVLDAPIEQ